MRSDCLGVLNQLFALNRKLFNSARTLQLEYRFDRLLPDKLAQAYQLLVPDRRRAIAGTS